MYTLHLEEEDKNRTDPGHFLGPIIFPTLSPNFTKIDVISNSSKITTQAKTLNQKMPFARSASKSCLVSHYFLLLPFYENQRKQATRFFFFNVSSRTPESQFVESER